VSTDAWSFWAVVAGGVLTLATGALTALLARSAGKTAGKGQVAAEEARDNSAATGNGWTEGLGHRLDAQDHRAEGIDARVTALTGLVQTILDGQQKIASLMAEHLEHRPPK
jgi:hypothetical protein